jgi:hypothetical protein
MPCRMSLSTITTKTFFLSSLLISLYYKSVNGASCTRTDIFIYGDCLTDIPIEFADMPTELIDMPIEVI